MIGSVLGDIAGSVYEFNNIKTTDFPFFSSTCFVTDDSVMTAAVAEAILLHRQLGLELADLTVRCMRAWGNVFPDAGYGGKFRLWLSGDIEDAYYSYGNGSAMRASPCADLADSLDQALSYAQITAAVTHNHPEGIRGAKAVAGAGFLARAGEGKDGIRRFTESCGYDLSFSLDEIRPSYSFNETCQESVPQAICAFLESKDYEHAIRLAISIGGDSDTIAAITGGIAWQYYKKNDPHFCGNVRALLCAAQAFLPDSLLPLICAVDDDFLPLIVNDNP